MNYDDRELNDAELEMIAGGKGLDCQAAATVSEINSLTAIALAGLGDVSGSAKFAGEAKGVLVGGCGPAPY